MNLWNNEIEIIFFKEALKSFASPEQLFYNLFDGYYAYIPKGYNSEGKTLQSRNSLIGKFTEKWCKDYLEPIAKKLGLYAVNGVICDEICLSKNSSADLAFCTTNEVNQKSENIKLIFEVKMSVVSNYKFSPPDNVEYISSFEKHTGIPSLLRSDSMLKAIGKSINIRVSGKASTKIPIIVLGNSPIKNSYIKKADFLKTSGVVQGFWSLNPSPTDSEFLKNSPKDGFQTIINQDMLYNNCKNLIKTDMNYFSSMISKSKLGEIILISSKEKDAISKAEKFLTLISN